MFFVVCFSSLFVFALIVHKTQWLFTTDCELKFCDYVTHAKKIVNGRKSSKI